MRNAWWVDFQFNHKRYRERSPVNSREGALTYESTIRSRLARGLDPIPSNESKPIPSFLQFAEEWYKVYVKTNNKASTHRSKRTTLSLHLIPFFGTLPLDQITTLQIEQYKAFKVQSGLSPKTVNNQLSILRKCLTTAEEWELLPKLPKVLWLRVPPPRHKFLSAEESQRLLNAAENQFWFAMILCALRTGMRLGELCALDWSDINWKDKTILVRRSIVEGVVGSPKNNRTRLIPMTDDLAACLYSFRKASGWIFPGPNGGHMTRSSWPWKALRRACKAAGLPQMGWHVLRHTFASQLTANSVPMKAIQTMLGHSTILMTERYSHLAQSSLHQAVATLPKATLGVNLASTLRQKQKYQS